MFDSQKHANVLECSGKEDSMPMWVWFAYQASLTDSGFLGNVLEARLTLIREKSSEIIY